MQKESVFTIEIGAGLITVYTMHRIAYQSDFLTRAERDAVLRYIAEHFIFDERHNIIYSTHEDDEFAALWNAECQRRATGYYEF